MTFTTWANDGECVATAKDPISLLPCGPGTQKQTRTCKDGTIEKCNIDAVLEPLTKSVTCELTKCTGKLGLLNTVMFHNILKYANYSALLSI